MSEIRPTRPDVAAMDDYYGELVAAPDRFRAVGWESEAGAHRRYEAVLDHLRTGDSVLDLGAGLGELGRYLLGRLEVTYVGVERDSRLIARARSFLPHVALIEADFMSAPLERADVVVLIGAAVDGGAMRDDGVRFGKLRRMFERARVLGRREVLAVVLDQDVLEKDPVRSLEPALGGMRMAELPWLCPEGRLERLVPLPHDPGHHTDLLVRLPGTAG